jgi:hypothetical protein
MVEKSSSFNINRSQQNVEATKADLTEFLKDPVFNTMPINMITFRPTGAGDSQS